MVGRATAAFLLIQGDVRITGTAVHSVPDRKVLLMAEVGATCVMLCSAAACAGPTDAADPPI